MKTLIVEDEPEFRLLLSLLLRKNEYEVVEAMDGQTAWDILQRERIPLVLTDWVMPQMHGPELIRKIRSANFPYYTYIILLTARTAHQDVVDGLRSGADDYLVKPFDSEELGARLTIAERIIGLEARLRETLDQMRALALKDSLTGILNRRAILETAEDELERAHREHSSLSILMCDLDHLKSINDRFGHAAGDQALKLAIDSVVKNLRQYDHVGRWGGDEFLIILPNTEMDEAYQIAERLRLTIERVEMDLEGKDELGLRMSLGVTSTSTQNNLNLDMLVKQADVALYLAKNNGKNQVRIYQGEEVENNQGEHG
jgi:two-component system chemotaxis response regulator CheY